MGDPAMTEHLGGPESPDRIVARQERYEREPECGTSVEEPVLPVSPRSLDQLCGRAGRVCRKLGFTLVDVSEYEYPNDSGNIMRCNDWRLDLIA
jgi:hypothetical protein